ncbi:hypothetical protein CARUB_v100045581mg, partial [Capsella rubella]
MLIRDTLIHRSMSLTKHTFKVANQRDALITQTKHHNMEMMTLVSLCLATFLSFLFLKRIITTTKRKLPPSPKWWLPVIGNLHQLGPNIHRSFHSLSLKYGPLMLIHFGSVPLLVVSCPQVTNDIVKTHNLNNFANRHKSKSTNIYMEGGRNILFASYGEDWKHMK